jgi:hypothetical protein
MKTELIEKYKSIGYQPVNGKHNCDGCGQFGKVMEYGGMTESGYESDYIFCEKCLKQKHHEIR